MSWIATPRAVFRIGPRQVIQARLHHGEEMVSKPKAVIFYANSQSRKAITIIGTSTASAVNGREFDYRYEGPEIEASEIGPDSVIADVGYEEALKAIGYDNNGNGVSGAAKSFEATPAA